MKLKLQILLFIAISLISDVLYGQNITLYQQFNGRYDFVFIGNTLNTVENNNIEGMPEPPCTILTSSAATLNLNSNDVVESAYLYWAGCGTGDLNVKLNGQDIVAQRTFSIQNSGTLAFFSAFANVTPQIQATGNGLYTLSDLDLTDIIATYCPFAGNFGGWALVIVYKNNALPLNQLNIYDGLQSVPNAINITLNSLNVIDNQDAKIGFIAWEGDKNISKNESLRINGTLIGNPPLNPNNNAFNGTNSFTGSDTLFNMDLDVYAIQDNIQIGDTSAQIQLTSSQDFVMVNTIVTKLNSQLPDATIAINATEITCNSRTVLVNYTVSNLNSTSVLPAATPIAVYFDGTLIQNLFTSSALPINGSQSSAFTLTIPAASPDTFLLKLVVDDTGNGQGIVAETTETNNSFYANLALILPQILAPLPTLSSCNLGLTKGIFDFSAYEDLAKTNPTDVVQFYPSMLDLENGTNAISSLSNYTASSTPTTIFVKIGYGICYNTSSFLLTTENCPPKVYNFISANNDYKNDVFTVDGLRDIFLNFKISIYNRWGVLVWTGDNNAPDWDGHANNGLLLGSSEVPDGTYYYSLELNDPKYPNPIVGYLYLTR